MRDEKLAQKLTGRKDSTPEQAVEMVNALAEAASLAEFRADTANRTLNSALKGMQKMQTWLHEARERAEAAEAKRDELLRYIGRSRNAPSYTELEQALVKHHEVSFHLEWGEQCQICKMLSLSDHTQETDR